MSSLTDQLTSRQANIFEFIKDRIQGRGYGPTVREIGEHFQISSPNGVMCHLRALERKGLLKRVRKHDRAIARAMEIAPEITAEEKGMPLAGTVAAGLTTLSLLSRPGIYKALETRGKTLQAGFEEVLRKYRMRATINRIGSMMTLLTRRPANSS